MTTNTLLSPCRIKRVVALIAMFFVGVLVARSFIETRPQVEYAWQGESMGTVYTVKVVAIQSTIDKELVDKLIKNVLISVDEHMSTYRPDSELSQWNKSQSTDWFPVSNDTLTVVEEAIRIGRLSDGAFDVTLEPLVRLWNFGADSKSNDTVPSDGKIKQCLESVGYAQLETRRSPPAVRKGRPEIHVDLSGIAKGFAVDRITDALLQHGIENFMVEFGGEVRAHGHNLSDTPWQIAIESPVPHTKKIYTMVRLDNRAMATSGDYRNYFENNDVRYCHILDPRVGRPISHQLASVSVFADTCTEADALATALMVLGHDAGYELAEKNQISAVFIFHTNTGFVEKRTSQFQ